MAIQAHLVELERKHKVLENELHEALVHLSTDDLQIVELKRRKLMVKDEIERLRHTAERNAALADQHRPIAFVARKPIGALTLPGCAFGCVSDMVSLRNLRCRLAPCGTDGRAHIPASSPTWSAIASDDVSPGDSIPNRLISPSTP